MVLRPRPVEHACTSSRSDMTSSPSRCPHPKQYFFCPVKKKKKSTTTKLKYTLGKGEGKKNLKGTSNITGHNTTHTAQKSPA